MHLKEAQFSTLLKCKFSFKFSGLNSKICSLEPINIVLFFVVFFNQTEYLNLLVLSMDVYLNINKCTYNFDFFLSLRLSTNSYKLCSFFLFLINHLRYLLFLSVQRNQLMSQKPADLIVLFFFLTKVILNS